MRRHLVGLTHVAQIVDVPVGHDEIRPAVQIAIEKLRSESQRGKTRVVQTCLSAQVDERPSRLLPVKCVGFVGVVRDEQVQQAVAVGISDGDSHVRPEQSVGIEGQTGNQRLFDKLQLSAPPVGLIDEIEIGRFVVADEQVQASRALEVGGDDPQTIAVGGLNPGRLGNVLKCAVAATQVPDRGRRGKPAAHTSAGRRGLGTAGSTRRDRRNT